MLRTVCSFLALATTALVSCFTTQELPGPLPSDPISVVVLTERARAEPVVDLAPTPIPAAVPLAPLPDLRAASVYAMRTLDSRSLLRYVMGDRRFEAIAPKIARETAGTWNCGVNNRTSSAAGLGQTLKTQGRIAYLESLGMGLTWADVRGPDCLADVLLIEHLYEACGLGDWTPPYKCLRPLPK